jgi:hypothetical protein
MTMNTNGLGANSYHENEEPAAVVRDTIELAVAVHGLKRGLYRVAEMLGVKERWITSLRFGQPARVSAEAYLRAIEARQALAAERAAQLRAELAYLDKITRERLHESANGLAPGPTGSRPSVGQRTVPRGGSLGHCAS